MEMYNYDRAIPNLIYPPTNFPNESSTIDFLEINFSQRLVVDITINRANNPPKVVTISNGTYAIIKYVFDGLLYKVAGRIRDIHIVNNNDNESSIRPAPIKPSRLKKSVFIIEIDCSNRCESRVYNISSDDIRDIEIFNPDELLNEHHHHHHECNCDNCNCNNTDTDDNTDTDNTETGEDITIPPDLDLEDDNDFGTDTDPTTEEPDNSDDSSDITNDDNDETASDSENQTNESDSNSNTTEETNTDVNN